MKKKATFLPLLLLIIVRRNSCWNYFLNNIHNTCRPDKHPSCSSICFYFSISHEQQRTKKKLEFINLLEEDLWPHTLECHEVNLSCVDGRQASCFSYFLFVSINCANSAAFNSTMSECLVEQHVNTLNEKFSHTTNPDYSDIKTKDESYARHELPRTIFFAQFPLTPSETFAK